MNVGNLPQCCSETQIVVVVMPKRYSTQKASYWYRMLTALRSGKTTTLAIIKFLKVLEQDVE
jgi:hypothetical protein